MLKRLLIVFVLLVLVGAGAGAATFFSISSTLPQITTLKDYKPLLVSEVYARGGEKIGEFYRENRILTPYDQIPKNLINSFLAAEDANFFQHGGINYTAILRAMFRNIIAGKKREGASTITQQVARALLLTSEKTYTRKIKEILLSYKIEASLSKDEILYLYLNQIYFGQGAYGIAAAADTYFRKPLDNLTIAEMAILAGLPKAPSENSPATNPKRAKERQRYVLKNMVENAFITAEQGKVEANRPIQVYTGKEYKSVGPYFVETVRLMLVDQLGEKSVLDEGLKIYTSLDYKSQEFAQEQVQTGLREVDKRQGWRGALKNLKDEKEIEQFLLASRREQETKNTPFRVILPEGNVQPERTLAIFHKLDASNHVITNLPPYLQIGQRMDAVVTKVDDTAGLAFVRFGECQGVIPIEDMAWAHRVDLSVNSSYLPRLSKPSSALKVGDQIMVKLLAGRYEGFSAPVAKKKGAVAAPVSRGLEEFARVALDQEPLVEGALLSIDQKSGDVVAMVGGYEFKKNVNEFNRALQAKRQTGSSFKSIVYTSALDKGYTPATPILDAPIVFDTKTETDEGEEEAHTWKPHNSHEKFGGDILIRSALARSLNIPAVKLLESVSIPWVFSYARRLGIFSPLNNDLSLALGSSSITLYEMTKVFSEIGRQGLRTRAVVIHKVLDNSGKEITNDMTLDQRFSKEYGPIEKDFDENRKAYLANKELQAAEAAITDPLKKKTPNIYFENPEQLISPQTAYVMTTLLEGVINDPGGTAGQARALGRPAAGKTGSTNGYFDGWFVGFTPHIATGVWVGFDEEKTLGTGEFGGNTALPIWLEYMKAVHKDLPVSSFAVPPGIVFANIDGQTGKLASSASTQVVNQAFIQGTEPKEISGAPSKDDPDFYKEDLNE